MNVKHDLEVLIEKYKDKNFFTFEVNFVNMAKDCLREINRLERENIELRKQLKEHFDNPPLKFKELKKNMWIWDNKNKCWLYLFKPLDWEPIKGLRYAERIIEHSAEGYYMDFEKGRFYRNQVEE
ncbi:hypothetical protein [Holdemania sp. 1001302B_160321_E10]|uniref:hypothetical protein n=1 Tax=Holdemania sp. 1001302B_160321_E10 TaxID=2787120 RepID=UPI0018984A2B|nr:hypothetical protein [Holdemania sp. 1001302B_160321_E10]